MTQEQLKKVREQISKLLNLAENNSNPNEAAIAAAKAQELMTRYNLSLAEVSTQDSTHDPLGAYINDDYFLNFGKRGRMIKWKRHLINAIARHNFCHIVVYKNTDMVSIVGEEHNISFVTYLYEYLVYQLEFMGERAWNEYTREIFGPVPRKKSTFLQSFYFGAVNTIHRRLSRQKVEFTKTNPNTKALMVMKDRESEAALESFFSQLKSSRGPKLRDRLGFESGKQAGREVNLNRPIRSGEKSNHLLN